MSDYFRTISIIIVMVFAWTDSHATPINVGTIKFDQYQAGTVNGLGGVDIIAHYRLNGNFSKQDCCAQGDIRWLQRVTSSAATGFTPTPNRPFIDPRSDQPGGFDNLPWYDATFGNLNDARTNQNRLFGSGNYFLDTPRVLLTRGPYSFFAQTLLVCIDEFTKRMFALGGFSWGFEIAADQTTVTGLPITQIDDNAALRNDFNTALGIDFPGWTMIAATAACGPSCPYLNVPEPNSLALFCLGFVALLLIFGKKLNARLSQGCCLWCDDGQYG